MQPLTTTQEKYLISLVRRAGLKKYRALKVAHGIEYSRPIPQLSKGEASLLIDRLKSITAVGK